MHNFQLYKFGDRKHIFSLIHNGELFLNPATGYDDEKLSKGAFDPNELIFEQELPKGCKIEAFCGKTGKSKGKFNIQGSNHFKASSNTNYYMFCLTYNYLPTFYEEFKADTCLVINDPDRFINQACLKIKEELPGWFINAGSVFYRSNKTFYSLYPTHEDIFYGKESNEFKHQFEIRIVCVPPKPTLQLESKIIYIGDLYGYTHITGIENPEKMIESEYSNSLGSPFKCN